MKIKRLLSLIFALVLIFSAVPAASFADFNRNHYPYGYYENGVWVDDVGFYSDDWLWIWYTTVGVYQMNGDKAGVWISDDEEHGDIWLYSGDDVEEFACIMIDGEEIPYFKEGGSVYDPNYYYYGEGKKTVVQLRKGYLETLDSGVYMIDIRYGDFTQCRTYLTIGTAAEIEEMKKETAQMIKEKDAGGSAEDPETRKPEPKKH